MIQKLLLFTGRFIFRTASIFILLCNLFVLCVYAYLRSTLYDGPYEEYIGLPLWQEVLLVQAIFVYFLVGVILYWPRKERQAAIPSRRPLFRRFFTLLSGCFFLYLVVDGPPPKEIFTKEYLQPRDPSVSQPTKALDILLHASKEEVPNLTYLSKDRKYEDIEAYTAEIEGSWKYIVAQRAAVDKLSGEPEFLDIIEADYLAVKPFSGLKVSAIYQSYALLRARQGDVQGAVEVLTRFHEVVCKGLQGSVDTFHKTTWATIASRNMRTALQLVCEYDLNDGLRAKLTETFDPITDEEASFFKPWVGEYIGWQWYLDCSYTTCIYAKWIPVESFASYHLATLLPESLVAFLFRLTRLKNSSAQLLYDFWVPIIHTSMSETYGRHVVKEEDLNPPITLRNVGGWYFYQPPNFLNYEKRMKETQVKSELFSYFLKNNAPLTPAILTKLAVDGLRDVGEDGKRLTKDDIALELYYPVSTNK